MQQKSLFKNTIYKSILSLVNIVVPLIIGPYITRLLDVELYGIYNKTFSVFQVFLAFASFGVYTFGVREISKIRNDKKKVSQLFTNLFIISLMSNIIVTIIYIIYSINVSNGITTSIYMTFLIQIVANIIYIEFVNEAVENYKFITVKSVIVKLIYFASILLFLRNSKKIILYSIIVSLTVLLNNLISFMYAKKKIHFDFSNIEIKKYIKPLIAVLVITNVDLLYSQLDRIMLGKYVNDVSVTLYFIPYYIVSTLVSIPYSIINVSIPRLSYILKNESKEKYEEKLNNSISSLLFIIIPMCLGVFVVAKEVIFIYAGKKYMATVIPLMIACVTRIFISMESVMNNLVMYPNDKENRILKVSLCCGLLNLLMNYVLVYFNILNPSTALITTGISEIIVLLSHYFYAKKTMNLSVEIISKKNVTYIILGLLFIPISFAVRKLNLGFAITLISIIAICSFIYFIVLYIKKDNNLFFIMDKLKNKFRRSTNG